MSEDVSDSNRQPKVSRFQAVPGRRFQIALSEQGQCNWCLGDVKVGEAIFPVAYRSQSKYWWVHGDCARGFLLNAGQVVDENRFVEQLQEKDLSEARTPLEFSPCSSSAPNLRELVERGSFRFSSNVLDRSFIDRESQRLVPPVCKHWRRKGMCYFEDKCFFRHPKEALKSFAAKAAAADARRSGRGRVPRHKQSKRRKRVMNIGRAGSFRRFLLDTYGADWLRIGGGVLDVAGGKGEIGFELQNLNGVDVTVIDPRPLNLKSYRKKLKYGLYHRNPMLREYNENPAIEGQDLGARDAVPPKHLRIFFTSDLIDFAAQEAVSVHDQYSSSSETQSVQWTRWYEFWEQANEEARMMRWTEKGIDTDAGVELAAATGRKVMTWTAPGAGWTDLVKTKDGDEDGVPYAHVENAEDESRRVDGAEEAYATLMQASLIVGMHPDQAAGDIVDFAIKRRIPFAITPCCVYGNSFPKRKTRDGSPVRSYEQLCNWLVEKHPAIRKTVLDFEGKNVCIFIPRGGYGPTEEPPQSILTTSPVTPTLQIAEETKEAA